MVHLQHLQCEGLYSFQKPINIEFTDNMIIVGPNNSGKTSLFRLLKILVDSIYSRFRLEESQISTDHYNPFLKVSLKFSLDETQKILDFLSFYPVKPNDYSQYCDFKNRKILLELFNEITIHLLWKKEIEGHDSEPYAEIEFPKIGLKFFNYLFSGFRISNKFPKKDAQHKYEPEVKLTKILERITEENPIDTINHIFNDEIQGEIGTGNLRTDRNKDHDDKANEILNKLFSFLEINPGIRQEITFSEILGKILQNGIIHSSGNRSNPSFTLFDYANDLKTPTRQPVMAGEEERSDFNKVLEEQALEKMTEFNDTLRSDGSNLIQYLFSLKNSPKQNDRTKFSKIQKKFQDLFSSSNLDFDVLLQYRYESGHDRWGRNNPPKPKIPTIMIFDNNLEKQFSINQVGSGVLEVIYLLTLAHGVSNSVILLDEPSVNLHPNLMKLVTSSLQDSDSANQFLIITHSPELASYEIFEEKSNILYFRKLHQHTIVKKLTGEIETWFNENRHRLKHQLDTRIFFGKSVILTEGDSDKNFLIGISHFFEFISKDVDTTEKIDVTKNDVIITQVGGKNSFANYLRLMKTFEIPYLVLADLNAQNHFESTGSINKNFVKFNGPVLLIENGDLEDLMIDIDSKAYSEAKRENGKSKPAIAYSFAEKVLSNPEKLQSFREIFQKGIELSKN